MKKKLYKLLLILLCCRLQAVAQTAGFKYEAAIQPVDSSGFYNIVLTPALNAHLKTDYSDLRIVNDTGKWVPHLLGFPGQGSCDIPVEWYLKIVKNETANNVTQIIVRANDDKVTDLTLIINKPFTEKYCTLSGSNNMDSWFIINDSIRVVSEKDGIEFSASSFTIRFPPVSYKFFKISMINNEKEDFVILKARSTATKNSVPGQLHTPEIGNPKGYLTQKEINNFSLVRIQQPAAYHFNKFAIKVSGVKYFNRKAKLYIPFSANHSFSDPGSFLTDFIVSNNSTLQFPIPICKASTFYISIQNDDNLPMKVDEVKTFNDQGMATVYLEREKRYRLIMDNPAASVPNYDLSVNNISSRVALPSVILDSIKALPQKEPVKSHEGNSKGPIWFLLITAAIILAFFTYRLVTDMNKSKA